MKYMDVQRSTVDRRSRDSFFPCGSPHVHEFKRLWDTADVLKPDISVEKVLPAAGLEEIRFEGRQMTRDDATHGATQEVEPT